MSVGSLIKAWWLSLWEDKPPRKQQSHGDGAALTPWECYYIERNRFRCPDCEKGILGRVAEGGAAVNVECTCCESAFNLSVVYDEVSGERISSRRARQRIN